MKYCSKCGKELVDEAVICVGCGCPVNGTPSANTQKTQQAETSGLATGAIICAFLLPLVGLILGIIGNSKYSDPQLKQKSKSAIFISLGMWIIYIFIFLVLGQL